VTALVPAGGVVERDFSMAGGLHQLIVRGQGWTALLCEGDLSGNWVLVTATSPTLGDKVLAGIVERAPTAPPESETDSVVVRFWRHNHGRPSRQARRIDVPIWSEIADHYPESVAGELGKLAALHEPAEAGGKLVLLHGPVGVGKTTFLRALAHAWRDWCEAHYVVDVEAFFGDASYMLEAIEGPAVRNAHVGPQTRLIIVEDLDGLIRSEQTNESLGRLLNLADGLPGQGLRFLLALTTNTAPANLHPALVRPGRCLARVGLRAFSAAEASAWLGSPQSEELTLAELLERRGELEQVHTENPESGSTGQYL
jgi:Domain of unknown function (DUF5925)/ATPase family associated with various cellular activities (AAA)